MDPISQSNYKDYSGMHDTSPIATKEQQEQVDFVTAFMDIYENSFE